MEYQTQGQVPHPALHQPYILLKLFGHGAYFGENLNDRLACTYFCWATSRVRSMTLNLLPK